jgi:hypothetical protein
MVYAANTFVLSIKIGPFSYFLDRKNSYNSFETEYSDWKKSQAGANPTDWTAVAFSACSAGEPKKRGKIKGLIKQDGGKYNRLSQE